MMSKRLIEALLVMRIQAIAESCNSYHVNHVNGQIRALAGVLTGKRPPPFDDAFEVLEFVGIPYHRHGRSGMFSWDRKWLQDHGFTISGPEGKERITHPEIESW